MPDQQQSDPPADMNARLRLRSTPDPAGILERLFGAQQPPTPTDDGGQAA